MRVKTKAPKTIYKTFVNKRTLTAGSRHGTISKVPVGVDPSFNFNQGNYSRDLVLFDDFMKKAKKTFPERFENIAETILRNEIKKEQFESFIEKAFEDKTASKNITAVGFISSAISKYLMNKIGIDIGESITVGLEARLLNGLKAKRHALKNEAIKKSDAENILKCLLYGDVYFQKNNKNILYLYKVGDNKYLQIAVRPNFTHSKNRASIQIPSVRNIQFLNDKQVKSKYEKSKLLEVIK